MDSNLNTTLQGLATRFRGVAASHDLNKFSEGVVRDLAELFNASSGALLAAKRVEDVLGAQIEGIEKIVSSLRTSTAISQAMCAIMTLAGGVGASYGVAYLPEVYRGRPNVVGSCRLSVKDATQTITTVVDIGGTPHATMVMPILFKSGVSFHIDYWDTIGLSWVRMYENAPPGTMNEFYYDQAGDTLRLVARHVGSLIRIGLDNELDMVEVSSVQELANDELRFYRSPISNIIAVREDLVFNAGPDFFASVIVSPVLTQAEITPPSSSVIVDFFTEPAVWTATSGMLLDINGRPLGHTTSYRVLSSPALCHHDPLYGQITLPFTAEEDKLIVRSNDDVFRSDEMRVSTRIFHIHAQPIPGNPGEVYFDAVNQASPFNLTRILQDSVSAGVPGPGPQSPELNSAEIQTLFEQTDPIYAVDGRTDTPGWYLTLKTDLDDTSTAFTDQAGKVIPTSHLLVFYDITIPQDTNSHMLTNVIQVHPLPLFSMHLIDVRYSLMPFGNDDLGQGFSMDTGPDAYSQSLGATVRSAMIGNRDVPATILGAGTNIFWNAGVLELHIKRTEVNCVRLVFACDYNKAQAAQRRILIGASHIGLYHRTYKPVGSFQVEFDADSARAMREIRRDTSNWVNNKYALFNPDMSTDPRYADVRVVSDNVLEVGFGVRTDDLSGSITRFDNSATPSFNRLVIK